MIEINDKTCAYCDDCRSSLLKEIKAELESEFLFLYVVDKSMMLQRSGNKSVEWWQQYWKDKGVE